MADTNVYEISCNRHHVRNYIVRDLKMMMTRTENLRTLKLIGISRSN